MFVKCDPCLSLLVAAFSPAIEVDVIFFINDCGVNCFAFDVAFMGSGVNRKPLL